MSSIAAEHRRALPKVPARNGWGFIAAGVCLLALLSVVAMRPLAGPAPAQDSAVAGGLPVTPKLAALAQSDPGRSVDVIVRLDPGATAETARSFVRTAGGHPGESIGLINAFSARLDARDAQRLASQPGVLAVSLNGTTKPQSLGFKPNALETSYNQSVNTPQVWNHATGKGVGVAVIDTGIAGGLADFRRGDGSGSRVVASAVTNPDATTAEDTYGHGTHVAGLLAGDSSARGSDDPLRGRYAGTAPDASLISIKASDDHGDASVLDVIYGIEFAVEHKDEFNIRVLNLSLESTVAESYRTDPLDAAVEAAWFQGIVVVTAAGNRGSDSDAVDYAPGNDPYAISVGAVDDQGTKQTKDDLRADWSSRGTTQDGYAKPDLYAPGARMVSNLAPGSDFTSMCPDCVSGDGQYIRAGGTSMSAPVVAGIVATILEDTLVDARPGEGRAGEQPALPARRRSRGRRTRGLQGLQARADLERRPRAERDRRPRHRRGRLGPLTLESLPVEPLPLEPVAVERRHRQPEPELGRRQLRVRLRGRRPGDGRSRPEPVALEPLPVEPLPLVHQLVLLSAGP